MVESQLPKLMVGVRFPSLAPNQLSDDSGQLTVIRERDIVALRVAISFFDIRRRVWRGLLLLGCIWI